MVMSKVSAKEKLTEDKEIREKLVVELRGYMEENGTNQSQLAKDMGVSSGTLSLWLADKYNGSIADINASVKNFLDREKEKSENSTVEFKFVMTSVARKIFELARLCHLDSELGVIYGDAGLGKTVAVREYAKIYPDTILIETDPGWTERVVVKKIHRALGMDGRGYADEMMSEIVSRLMNSGRLIIVDETENLPSDAINLVRRIPDHARVGLLLVGMPRLVHNLRGRKGELAQLYSRSGMSYHIDSLKDQDTEEIVKSCLPDSNGLWKTFHKECDGNARVLSKLILRSIRFAELNKSAVTTEHIRNAKKFITV
jgi:hypothetical protein